MRIHFCERAKLDILRFQRNILCLLNFRGISLLHFIKIIKVGLFGSIADFFFCEDESEESVTYDFPRLLETLRMADFEKDYFVGLESLLIFKEDLAEVGETQGMGVEMAVEDIFELTLFRLQVGFSF